MMQFLSKIGGYFAKVSPFASAISLLAVRLWMAKVFFMSGLTKIKSWETTTMLFSYEYEVPLISPELAAMLATGAELLLPVLLVIGLMTPIAALGLFIMSLVIELFVYPGTTEHYYWLLLLGVLIAHGSGFLGLDRFVFRNRQTA